MPGKRHRKTMPACVLDSWDGKAAPRLFASGAPTDDGKTPTQRFIADLLKIGTTYRHPKDGWELEVTPELADKIVATSQAMQSDGVAVPIVSVHSFDEEPDPDTVLGSFKGAFVEDGWVRGVQEFRGKAAIDAARRVNHLSVGLLPELTDGESHTYTDAIQHVALTPYPVVNQQRDFVPLAASRGRRAKRAPVLMLSAAISDEVTDMDMKLWRKLLGNDELDEDGLLDAVTAKLDELGKGGKEQKAAFDKLTAEFAELKEAKADKGDRDKATKLDADVEETLVEAAEAGIAGLVDGGKVTPAVAEKLAACLIGDPGKRNAFALSKAVSKRPIALTREVIKALSENDPVELAEQTGRQAVAASRETPGDAGDGFKEDTLKRMTEMANG